jgi:hypothetical protein
MFTLFDRDRRQNRRAFLRVGGSSSGSEPVLTRHLIATILHTLFDVGQLRLVPNLPREFVQVITSWEPIPGLDA